MGARLQSAGMPRPLIARTVSTPLLVLLLGSGCAHRVVFKSEPVTATVYVDDELIGPTPVAVRRTLWPFRKVDVRIEAQGYRTIEVPLHKDARTLRPLGDLLLLKWRKMLGLKARRVHTLVLVPEHGPSGTWTPDDARGE